MPQGEWQDTAAGSLGAAPEPQNGGAQTETDAAMTLSAMLAALAAQRGAERISVRALLAGMEGRARGALLILFALPNTLPGIPGTSAVTGLPLVFLTAQMALGRPAWLPAVIADRTVRRGDLAAVLSRAIPSLARVETCLRPRLRPLTAAPVERLIGLLTVVLSLVIMLPVPFGNMLPALAIILFALGLMERDGLMTAAGFAMAALALAVVATVLWAVIKSSLFVLLGAFGLG